MLNSSFDDEYKLKKINKSDKVKSTRSSNKRTDLSTPGLTRVMSKDSESQDHVNPLDETIDKLPYKRYHIFAFANPRSGDGLAGSFLTDYPPKNVKQLYFSEQK